MWVAQVPKPAVPLASLHKLLYGYFPGIAPDASRPFVYRIEHDSLIIGSSIRPACDAREVVPEVGRTYQFDAILKPMNGGGRNPIVGNSARREWVARNVQGAVVGFAEIHDMPDITTHKGNGRRITLPVCRAIGTLVVTDPASFTAFLGRGGPGTGKVYGCGMWVLPELMGVIVGRRHPFERRH